MPHSLLPVAEAQARLIALGSPLAEESCPIAEALGRWASRDLSALRTRPETDLSAMDGYAIRFSDLPGPWQVVGESAAGRPLAQRIEAGQAARIFTGAHLPDGADTVLVQEAAARDGARLMLAGAGPSAPCEHVRPRGLDFREGHTLVKAGERMTPARLALAAAAGHATVPVRRKVRVAVAATGDELVPVGSAVGDAQLPETNRLMLASQLSDLPIDLVDLGILPDRRDALENVFRNVECDLLVTSGGASVGDHDLVQPALRTLGAAIDFWRVALRPGKPTLAGKLGDAVVLGLPGNPVSAFVTTLLFVRPMIAHLSGALDPLPSPRTARLGAPLPATGARADYLRAKWQDERVFPAPIQDSSMLRPLAAADCLIVRPPHALRGEIGDSVEILDIG